MVQEKGGNPIGDVLDYIADELSGFIPFSDEIKQWSKDIDRFFSGETKYNTDPKDNSKDLTSAGEDIEITIPKEMTNAMNQVASYLEGIEAQLAKPSTITYSKQYDVDLNDIAELRRTIVQLAAALRDKSLDLSDKTRKFTEIQNHVTDYINGTQKKKMRQAYDASLADVREAEKKVADNQYQLSKAEQKKGLIDDLSIKPQTSINDQKVNKVANDLGVNVSVVTPNIYEKEYTSNVQTKRTEE